MVNCYYEYTKIPPYFVDVTVKLTGKKNLQSDSDGVGFRSPVLGTSCQWFQQTDNHLLFKYEQ